MDLNTLKRKMTLEFGLGSSKKFKQSPIKTEVLSSPDFYKLNLASPELEHLILNSSAFITPTSTFQTPTSNFQNTMTFVMKTPTTEQKEYVKGFDEALDRLRNGYSEEDDSSSYSGDNSVNCAQEQIVPINMKDQEIVKLERKRLRNRVAASKCRKRKIERISKLESRVNMIKNENSELLAVCEKLRSTVRELEREVKLHLDSGCSILVS